MRNKNCILFFSLTPEKDALRKRWTHSKRLDLNIATALYNRTLGVIKESKIPYFECNETHQSELDFGSNISSAIQHLLDKDFDNVIVVGNDCFELKASDLIQAEENLQKGIASIGETKDGGSYLFTVSADKWDAEAFEHLPWCKKTLAASLISLINRNQQLLFLKSRVDLDHLQNLKVNSNFFQFNNIRFLNMLFLNFDGFNLDTILKSTNILQVPQYRGPPCFA